MSNESDDRSLGSRLLELEPEAVSKMFRTVYGDGDDEPAAWVGQLDGRVNVNLRDELHNPIKAEWNGVGCFLCCDALDMDAIPAICTADDQTGKLRIFFDADTPERKYTPSIYLCDNCARWYVAMEHYERAGSSRRYRFVVGVTVWLADGTDTFEIRDRIMTGISKLGVSWPLYHGRDQKDGRRRVRSECELGEVVERVIVPSRSVFPPVRQISSAAATPNNLPTLEDLGRIPNLEDLRPLARPVQETPRVRALDFWKEKK